jgi:hypothetical protein
VSDAYTIDRARWAKLDIFNQMGNIYSEVGRSFKARQANDTEVYQAALARTIDLFDATVDVLVSRHSPKVKEMLRAKEQFLEVVTQKDLDRVAVKSLDRYFLQFALAARLHH